MCVRIGENLKNLSGFGQINGVCSPASACSSSTSTTATTTATIGVGGGGGGVGGGGGGVRIRPDPPRRSRSQGTRKLHKCLSTASYSEDCGGGHSLGPVAPTGQRQQQLLVARQYCSFGSTVTKL